MRVFLLIIAIIVSVTCGYEYAIVLWIATRIVASVIIKGAQSSSSYQTYDSYTYQSNYQSNYQKSYQHNNQHNTSNDWQKTESKSMEHYYSVLGVSSNATDTEVKKAYRKLAMEYHPDHCANSNEVVRKRANERFRKVNEAYEAVKELRQMK